MSDQTSYPQHDDTFPLPLAALESMPFPTNIYNRDGVVVAANMGIERLFNYPRDLTINTYNLYNDPITIDNGFRAAFERARAGETVTLPPNQFDPARMGLPGTPIWFVTTVFPFISPDNVIHFIGGVYQDVTAQIRAETESARLTAELERRAREFQPFYTLAENSPDGFVLADLDRRITYANQAYQEITGHGEQIVGLDFADMAGMEGFDDIEEVGRTLFTSGMWQGEFTINNKHGRLVPLQGTIFLLRDEQGNQFGTAAILRDLTAQRQAEAERVALQEQVIASQQATLRELSTPLIPLTDTVVVMPLIGTIDSQRAQQIMETLLEGIATYQAEVVLLDVSGVQVVDTQVADALLRAARAVQLLGAQIVLTGISAEIAQTIVHLGADMNQIITQANLQAGLRYAMERYGLS